MVDAEQVMIDDSFDQVEQTEADQERAGEQLGRPSYVPATGRPPQNPQPDRDEDVGGRVKKALPEGVDLQIFDAGGGIACVGQHMVPLQDLMHDDAVEEAPRPSPNRIPAAIGKPAASRLFIRPLPEAARDRRRPG
jgi:hypothetical protein